MGCCKKKIKAGKPVPNFTEVDIRQRMAKCKNCGNNRWNGLRMWCAKHHWYIPKVIRERYRTCFIGGW